MRVPWRWWRGDGLARWLGIARHHVELEIGGDRPRLRDPGLASLLRCLKGIELRLGNVRDRQPDPLSLFRRHRGALHGPLLERKIAVIAHRFPFSLADLIAPAASSAPARPPGR